MWCGSKGGDLLWSSGIVGRYDPSPKPGKVEKTSPSSSPCSLLHPEPGSGSPHSVRTDMDSRATSSGDSETRLHYFPNNQ